MAGAAAKSARSSGRGASEKDAPGADGQRRGAQSGDGGAPQGARFSREDELKAYRSMLLIRRFEEKAGQLYGMGLIGGFCHLYIGQEAVVIGMQMAAKPGDQVITGYRDHGHMLACGHGSQRRDGRAHRAPQRLFEGQGRLDAHVLEGEAVLRRPWHRRRAGAARHRPRLRQPLSRQRRACRSPISATAPPTRARSTKASTWPSSGSCRSST